MKKSILVLVALFAASTSNALVADKFKCSIEIKDLVSKNTAKQDKEFFVARLPVPQSTPPGADPNPYVRMTSGGTMERMTLDTPKATYGANLNFYYKHAIRSDASGPIEARQLTCVGLTAGYCPHSDPTPDDGIGFLCGVASVSCMEASNPFDPDNGWAQATMFFGVPHFNEQTLAPTGRDITDRDGNIVGVVNLSCQFLGSFN